MRTTKVLVALLTRPMEPGFYSFNSPMGLHMRSMVSYPRYVGPTMGKSYEDQDESYRLFLAEFFQNRYFYNSSCPENHIHFSTIRLDTPILFLGGKNVVVAERFFLHRVLYGEVTGWLTYDSTLTTLSMKRHG